MTCNSLINIQVIVEYCLNKHILAILRHFNYLVKLSNKKICTIYIQLKTCLISIPRFALRDKGTTSNIEDIYFNRKQIWPSGLGRWE